MQKQGWRQLLGQPVWLLSGGVAILLLLGFGLLFYSSWRHDVQLQPIQQHVRYIAAIEAVDEYLRELAVKYVTSESHYIEPSSLHSVKQQLKELDNPGRYLHSDTSAQLASVQRQLNRFDGDDRLPLDYSLQALRHVLASELTAHGALMAESRAMARRELRISLGILVGLALLTIPLGVIVRRRIVAPLDNLGDLMTLMSQHDYGSAPGQVVDPMLRPLFDNYNRMVSRLRALEQSHQRREETLTDSVRRATGVLLQQHRRLAEAERLGAIGEITASVAHELRNPLTSIHMALQNLRSDLQDPDHVERVDLVIDEIKRLSHQLTLLLESARQTPEVLTRVDVSEVLRELLILVRYQFNEYIALELDVPGHYLCRLPEAQFRQCMLNLIVNAGQMLGENPGKIELRLQQGDQQFRLIIEDDGPGFSDQILASGPRTFGSLRTGGTGLGLVMVRRFVSDVGGRMLLENRQPHGARVILDIPCGSQRHDYNPADH